LENNLKWFSMVGGGVMVVLVVVLVMVVAMG
jgi:hypothetical protein